MNPLNPLSSGLLRARSFKQFQAVHAMFPVGELLNPEVREVARRHGLPTAEKKDSPGILFIDEIKVSDFIRHFIPELPGEIVDTAGKM